MASEWRMADPNRHRQAREIHTIHDVHDARWHDARYFESWCLVGGGVIVASCRTQRTMHYAACSTLHMLHLANMAASPILQVPCVLLLLVFGRGIRHAGASSCCVLLPGACWKQTEAGLNAHKNSGCLPDNFNGKCQPRMCLKQQPNRGCIPDEALRVQAAPPEAIDVRTAVAFGAHNKLGVAEFMAVAASNHRTHEGRLRWCYRPKHSSHMAGCCLLCPYEQDATLLAGLGLYAPKARISHRGL